MANEQLEERAAEIDTARYAGASAPELLVQRVVARLREWGGEGAVEVEGREEHVVFALPRELRPAR